MSARQDKQTQPPLWLIIRSIANTDLQQIIFDTTAKGWKIDWSKIERKNLDLRADQILAEVLELQKQNSAAYYELSSSLRVIHIVATTKSILKTALHLKDIPPANTPFVYDLFHLDQPGEGNITHAANLVAWFCARQDKVKQEWEKIVSLAITEEQKNSSWSYFTIEPPTKVDPDEIQKGINEFEDKFGEEMKKEKKMPFRVKVHPLPSTGKFVRYAVTIPKDPFKTYLYAQDNITVGPDPTMHTFYLDRYIAEPTVRLTWPVACDERRVADLFVDLVFGSKVLDEPQLLFTKSLRRFTSSRTSEEAMNVADNEKDRIHSIFINSVDFTYAESETEADKRRRQRENKKRAKKGEELRPAFRCYNYTGNRIWAYLDEHFNPERYKPEWRDILSITFTVRLFKVVLLGNNKVYDPNKTKDFKIVCTPGKRTFRPRMEEIVEPEYKATLRYVADKKLGLIGESLSETVSDAQKEGTNGSVL